MPIRTEVDAITVNSVAAMVALKHVRDGQLVRTRGYYAVGDGGGNEFTFKATAGTEDGGFVIDRTLGGSFFANDTTVANVRQFGAKGDGATDDATAAQAALTATASTVLFGDGDFAVSTNLTSAVAGRVIDLGGGILRQGDAAVTVTLAITGDKTVLRNGQIIGIGATGTTDQVHFTSVSGCGLEGVSISSSGDSGVRFTSCTDSWASDCRFEGNHVRVGSGLQGNLQFSTCNRCTAANITINESFGKGISFSGGSNCSATNVVVYRAAAVAGGADSGLYTSSSTDITFSNFTTTNVTNKVSQSCARISIDNLNATTSENRALYLQGCNNVRVSNSRLTVSTTAAGQDCLGIHAHGVIEVDEIDIDNTIIESTGTPDALITHTGTGTNVRLTNCIMRDSGDQSNYAYGAMIPDAHTLTEYTDCTIEYTGSSAANVLLNDARGGIILRNCKVIHPNANAAVYTGSAGTCELYDCILSSNASGKGTLRLQGASLISGCKIDNLAANVVSESGIRIDAAGANSVIVGCEIDANGTSGGCAIQFTAAGAENVTIKRCSLTGTRAVYMTQSTTNSIIDCETNGSSGTWGVTSNAINGTSNPGAPLHRSGRHYYIETGSPEGVVVEAVGATASRVDGGAGTVFYIKESGSGNTGWSAVAPTALRKELSDTVAFSATPTYDFDAGTGDNKYMTLTANVTSSTFTATRPGDYNIILEQEDASAYTFAVPAGVIGAAPSLNTADGGKTLLPLTFDGTDWFWR